MKNLNKYVSAYHAQLKQGDILIAYHELVKFVMQLRTNFMKSLSDQYAFGGILHGYLDYTYFYYTNAELKSNKLKLAIVLNHVEMRFELWLLGNTQPVQKAYWEKMKSTLWNQGRTEMPKYAILEAVLVDKPDFDDLSQLATQVEKNALQVSREILEYLSPLKA